MITSWSLDFVTQMVHCDWATNSSVMGLSRSIGVSAPSSYTFGARCAHLIGPRSSLFEAGLGHLELVRMGSDIGLDMLIEVEHRVNIVPEDLLVVSNAML
jgi:hypothetical protein